jgi:predicted phage tail protein
MFWGFLMAIGWVVWVVSGTFRRARAARLQADVQGKLLDKFGSSRELLDYLHTTQGQRFLDFVVTERANPYSRILASAQAGLIMTLLGAALLMLRRMATVQEAADALLVFGTLVLTLGIGFLASGALSFILSRSWGLLEARPESPSRT